MLKFFKIMSLIFVIGLTGCAASVQKSETTSKLAPSTAETRKKVLFTLEPASGVASSKNWEKFRAEWLVSMPEAAEREGIEFQFQEGAFTSNSEPATLVRVKVNSFEFVAPGARYGLGILTGNAQMNVDVDFIELPSRRPLGSRKYNATSTAWEGIFSAMTDKQVRAVSTEIFREIAAK